MININYSSHSLISASNNHITVVCSGFESDMREHTMRCQRYEKITINAFTTVTIECCTNYFNEKTSRFNQLIIHLEFYLDS